MKKGFTLIELLIVIAIIGVLSSIVLASLNQARDKAKLTKALATMKQVNNSAFICVDGGGTLVVPTSSGVGGTPICSNDSTPLPDISDTGFTYCGNGCGGWTSNSQGYGFSIYSDSYSGGRKIVVCSSNLNLNGWYGLSIWDFVGQIACKKSGF